eukprot:4467794-Heterocapsa_arctica.AAC.1
MMEKRCRQNRTMSRSEWDDRNCLRNLSRHNQSDQIAENKKMRTNSRSGRRQHDSSLDNDKVQNKDHNTQFR